jgi:hypothetical protein
MHSIAVIENNLSKLQKLNYNQFFWWRRWARKNKPLHNYSPLIDKIENGDYDDSPTDGRFTIATGKSNTNIRNSQT